MNLVDRKMHFLRNYNHDFPRLAKQSGFFFQLHRGRVNWSEIECLDLDDITENRNFELLEQNLLNVINCNLEKECDLKILDQNFVKLFKLAQLGIDYLSYCELYLDRCAVLLQEQLMSIQEENESLKRENEKRTLKSKAPKTKKKIHNYQCEKCEKMFISDVYLKFHDKRRHSNLSTPKSDESSFKKLVDASQQTENEKQVSIAIQAVLDAAINATQENEVIRKIKKSHNKKFKRMERNVNDLSARLQKAEKSLQETREANPNSASFPPSVHYHALLQFMPPCFPASQNADEVFAEHQKILPESRSPKSDLTADVSLKASEGKKSFTSGNVLLKEYNAENSSNNSEAKKIDLISDKENVDPHVTRPLPPPRKTKKKFRNISSNEENLTVETMNQLRNSAHSATDVAPFNNRSIDLTSVKNKSEPNIHSETFEEIKASLIEDLNAKKTVSNESLNTSKEKAEELTFFKKVVGRSSPKLQKLSKNLKRPFTNFYDSVSSTGKGFAKVEKQLQSAKTVLVDDLNNQLREMGIDPEWKGIPKKTMKQKLKDLTHRRKLLFKENSLYPFVRKSAEEKIFEKLKKNFSIRKTLPQKSSTDEVREIHPTNENPRPKSQESENVENRNCAILYDTDMDSCSTSEMEKTPRKQVPSLCAPNKPEKISESESEEEIALKLSEKDFDVKMFQIKKEIVGNRLEKCKKDSMLNEVDEPLTNSDLEEEFSTRSNDGIFKAFSSYVTEKNNYGKR